MRRLLLKEPEVWALGLLLLVLFASRETGMGRIPFTIGREEMPAPPPVIEFIRIPR